MRRVWDEVALVVATTAMADVDERRSRVAPPWAVHTEREGVSRDRGMGGSHPTESDLRKG